MKNKTKVIIVLFFTILIIFTAETHTHLKKIPQIVIYILSLLTLLSFILKKNVFTTILSYILIGYMLFTTILKLSIFLLDLVSPRRGLIIVDGIERRVMNWDWIYCVIIGFVLTPIFLYLYGRLQLRNRYIEFITILILNFVTLIIYLIHEVF